MNNDNEKITKLDMDELNEVTGGAWVRLYSKSSPEESKPDGDRTASANAQNGKASRPPILKA